MRLCALPLICAFFSPARALLQEGELVYWDRSQWPVLKGADVVAYHSLAEGSGFVEGLPEFAYNLTSEGVEWTFLFASQENRDTFASDPWAYAPRLGGFCLYGMANEWHKDECEWSEELGCDGDCQCNWPWLDHMMGPPAGVHDGWFYFEGSLYFNIWRSYTELVTSKGAANFVARAEARWIEYYGSLEAGPFNTHCWGDINDPTGEEWRRCTVQSTEQWRQEMIGKGILDEDGNVLSPAPPPGSFTGGSSETEIVADGSGSAAHRRCWWATALLVLATAAVY
mmetsp:Transcript_28122/g.91880  ORF Transcript_28122/g.91880 Transcript_28122/m.91880 type:complete len:283 (-) Transcript_28122:63-911(-)